MIKIKNYFFYDESKSENLGNGISRKILAHNGSLMTVEVSFEKEAVGILHSHIHEQMTYVLEGEFVFKIGDKEKIVKAGDVLYKESNVEHGCICLEKGKLIDIFTPIRQDFIK
ncbi:MAG: cupin domain-containing protein [Paraclostridium sp.]|uniref:cupin domain-containing protein n=1 Tax=Paraclostridium sp. TaxID=2023273 RepID=UPI003F3D14E5